MFKHLQKIMIFRIFYFIIIVPLVCTLVWMAMPGLVSSTNNGCTNSVQTNPATNISGSSAVLNGYLSTCDNYFNVYFQYGTTKGGPYPYTTTAALMSASGPFYATVQGLTACTQYYYIAVATFTATQNNYFDQFRVFALPPSYIGNEQSFITNCTSNSNNGKKLFGDDSSPSGPGGNTGGMTFSGVYTSQTNYAARQPVTIYARVMNTGDIPGGYTATLKINGIIEQTKIGTIKPQVAEPLEFTVIKDNPGTYQVEINGLKTSFTITDAAQKSNNGTNPQTTVLIIISLAVVALLLLVVFLWRQRQS
jgi:hypothetical protein